MRRRRKIKILATLGPSSNTSETIEQLFRAGGLYRRLYDLQFRDQEPRLAVER